MFKIGFSQESIVVKTDSTEMLGDPVIFGPTTHVYPKLHHKTELNLADSLKIFVHDDTVIVQCIITEFGKADSCVVIRSTNKKLNDFSRNYIMQWKFIPGKINGRPSKYMMRIPITF